VLEKAANAARKILGANYAAVGILEEDAIHLQSFVAMGMDAEIAAKLGKPVFRGSIFEEIIEERKPRLAFHPLGEEPGLELPADHPVVHSFLGVPLQVGERVYGWIYVAEKLAALQFSDEDTRILMALAAQTAIAYENAEGYREIQRWASELERRVEERTAELTETCKELEAFTYSVSHDLRAPLRHIASFAQILAQDYAGQIPPEFRQHLERIQAGARTMAELIDGLLELSKVGRKDAQRQRTSLDGLVREVLRELEPETQSREIEWRIAALPAVDADPMLIRQVFMNLLSNAVKYSRRRARAVIEVGALQRGADSILYVRNNGVGFDAKYADKLFSVFQRLHRPEDFEGTGVGLAIVQRIIHKHGGRIWAEAEVGKGAVFYFTLGPRGSDEPAAEGTSQVPPRAHASPTTA